MLGRNEFPVLEHCDSPHRTNVSSRIRPASNAHTARTHVLVAGESIIYARADYLNRWADFVSQTGADPVIANLPARYVRSTK